MTFPDELTCQELVELVTDYLEDALSPAERVRFEEHLIVCPDARPISNRCAGPLTRSGG